MAKNKEIAWTRGRFVRYKWAVIRAYYRTGGTLQHGYSHLLMKCITSHSDESVEWECRGYIICLQRMVLVNYLMSKKNVNRNYGDCKIYWATIMKIAFRKLTLLSVKFYVHC